MGGPCSSEWSKPSLTRPWTRSSWCSEHGPTQVTANVEFGAALVVVCPRWSDGQAASLHCGLAALEPEVTPRWSCSATGPGSTRQAVLRMIVSPPGAAPTPCWPPTTAAGRSHPVVLPRAVWSQLPASGETPGRTLDWEAVDCTDLAAPGDVDYAS